MMGGMKGVLYTDAFQGAVMVAGMVILLGFTYSALGGVVSANTGPDTIALVYVGHPRG